MSFDWTPYDKKPTTFFGYIGWLYFIYCLLTGLYMIDAWERMIFNSVLMLVISMCVYTTYIFLPGHLYAIASVMQSMFAESGATP